MISEQAQIARRVEEVRAEPVPAEIVRAALGERADRDARRVRAMTIGPGPPLLVHPRQQLLLDIQPLDDRFDHPVGGGDLIEVRVEAAGGDERGDVGRELRIGLQLASLVQALPRDVGGEVEQQRRECRRWRSAARSARPSCPAPSTATELIGAVRSSPEALR